MLGSATFETLANDFKFSVRTLTRNPAFTCIVVLTIALGIGANSAMFSVVQGVILAPLPFPESDRLVFLWQNRPGVPQLDASYPNFEDWNRISRSFQSMSAIAFHEFDLSSPGKAEHLTGIRVSSAFLSTLGVKPAIGQDLDTSNDVVNAPLVALISNRLWKERFGADPGVTGKSAILDGKSYVIAGVLPQGFHFLVDADVFTSLLPEMPTIYQERSVDAIGVFARLKRGVTIGQASAEMNTIQSSLDRQYPDENRGVGIVLTSLKQQITGEVKGTVLLMFGAVTLVLLIACANVATLLLARSASRTREFGIRSALGASRIRIQRQLLTEGILLSLAGSALGIAIAWFGLRALLLVLSYNLPRSENIGLHLPVLAFCLFVSIAAGVLFGLVPAFRSASAPAQLGLQIASRGITRGSNANLRRLVMLEFALTVVLLAGAGLLLRSVANLMHVNPGFDTRHVISFHVGLSSSVTKSPAAIREAYQQLISRIEQVPGIESADLTNIVPLSGGDNGGPFWLGTTQPSSLQEAPHAQYFWTGPDYLKTMGIPLLQGRFFSIADQLTSAKVVAIDSVLADNYFHGQNPIGQTITVGHWGSARIVGVVGHVRHFGLDDPGTYNPRQIYIPVYQLPDFMVSDFFRNLTLLARTRLPPGAVMPAIRNAVYAASPDQPVYGVKSIGEVVSGSMGSRTLSIILLGAFALLALLLASIGIYGVVSYSVMRRTPEFGIRMALGANKKQIILLVVKHAMSMAVAGLCIGTLAAITLVRLLPSFSHLLYGVGQSDPLTLAAAVFVLLIVAGAACFVPARRAIRVDPMDCLRTE
jgi:predicted permease